MKNPRQTGGDLIIVPLLCTSGFLLEMLHATSEIMQLLAHRGDIRDVVADTVKASVHVLEILVHGCGQRYDCGREVLETFVHALAKTLLHIREAALGHGSEGINGEFFLHMVLPYQGVRDCQSSRVHGASSGNFAPLFGVLPIPYT